MHIRASVMSCGDDGVADIPWGASFRNMQTMIVALSDKNTPRPCVVKMLEFFTTHDKKETIDPPEISTYLLCEYGLFTKNVLLCMYNGKWISDRTCKDMYSQQQSTNFKEFLNMLVETKYPVIIHSNKKSYIILDIIKSKYTASLQIGDPLIKDHKRKYWVSAHKFLISSPYWMSLFIE